MRRDSSEGLSDVEAALAELEVSAEELRADPRGARWLPASLRARVERDPEVAALVAEYVEMELELAAAPLAAHSPSDALFTRDVVEALPDERGHRWRRTLVLATCHALALGAAWIIWGSSEGQAFVDGSRANLQSALDGLRGVEGPAALTLVVVAAVLLAWPALGAGGRGGRFAA